MARATEFQTRFVIGSKFTGQGEVNKANRAIDSVERNLKGMGRSLAVAHSKIAGLGKITAGVFGGIMAAAATRKIIEFGHAAVDAAAGVAKAHDSLGNALKRNESRYSMMGKSVEAIRERMIDLAEAQEKAGGFDAELIEAGWGRLLDTMNPQQIERFSGAYADMLAKLTEGQPTQETAIELSQQINAAIASGRPALLRRLNLSKQELETFRKLGSQEERRLFIEKIAQRYRGEQARWAQTTSGKVLAARTAFENLLETMGKPFIERAGSFADSFRKLSIGLGPLAEKIANKLAPAFEQFSNWVAQNDAKIIAFLENAVVWFGKLWEAIKSVWDLLNKIPVIWDIKKDWPDITAWFHDLIENTKKEIAFITDLIAKFKEFFKLLDPKWNAPSATAPIVTTPPAYMMNPATQQAVKKAQEASGGGTGRGESMGQFYSPTAAAISNTPSGQGYTPAHFANVRHKNPGAMYPGPAATKFGGKRDVLGSGHLIASFPSAVHGAAANFENLRRVYTGMTIADAMKKWSGGSRSMPGGGKWDPNMRITPAMTRDPSFMIPFMKAVAAGEAPGKYPMSEEQWAQAYDWYSKGAPQRGSGGTKVVQGPASANRNPFGVQLTGKNAPAPPPAPPPLKFPKTSGGGALVPAGSKLKDVIKDMNMRQRMSGATGGMNIAMNPTTTINGVTAGQEQAVARQFERVMQDSNRALIAKLKEARDYESRLGYV